MVPVPAVPTEPGILLDAGGQRKKAGSPKLALGEHDRVGRGALGLRHVPLLD
jgi:hypothetical protein